jgi:hypothetical protein
MLYHTANLGRVFLGVLLLLMAWFLGLYVGSYVCPQTVLLNKLETLASKVGCSVSIILASAILRRYIYDSFGLALACLAATEVVVFLVVMSVTGLWSLTVINISFNTSWLWRLTWNVAIAFLIGTILGQLWKKWADQDKDGPNGCSNPP